MTLPHLGRVEGTIVAFTETSTHNIRIDMEDEQVEALERSLEERRGAA